MLVVWKGDEEKSILDYLSSQKVKTLGHVCMTFTYAHHSNEAPKQFDMSRIDIITSIR